MQLLQGGAGHERIGVRGSGDLPDVDVVTVGLLRLVVAQRGQVALGLDNHHRDARIRADAVGTVDDRAGVAAPGKRCGAAAATVDEEPVELVRQRLHAVDVRRQPGRRLGLPEAITRRGVRPSRTSSFPGSRSAWATWVKMS